MIADSYSASPLTIPDLGVVPDGELEERYREKGFDAPGVQERVIELYDGEIRTADAAINQVFEEIKKMNGLENTISVITSDHGEAFREHGTTTHGKNFYPETYEVPLIFSWPDCLSSGTRISNQVRSIDIAPTLFDLTGLLTPRVVLANRCCRCEMTRSGTVVL